MPLWRSLSLATAYGLFLLAGIPGPAVGSGFQIRENSATGLGTAFAGAGSAADDPSTVFNNPAGMVRFEADAAAAAISVVLPSASFEGGARAGPVPVGGKSGVDAGAADAVPAFYAVYGVSPAFKFGMAITTPFGLSTSYPANWVGRYAALDSELTTVNINPNVAYRLTDRVSLAGGLVIQRLDATETNALPFAALGAPDGLARISGDGWGVGFNGALLFEPMPGTRFGLAYRSQVSHTIEGRATFGNVPSPLLALSPALRNQDVRAQIRTPATLTASVYHEVTPRLALMADLQWTQWSAFKRFSVFSTAGPLLESEPENWSDSWFGAAGAVYRPDETLALRAGLAYDATPTNDSNRTARLPDNDRLWIAFGFTRMLRPGLDLTGGYAHLFAGNARIGEAFGSPLLGAGRLTGSYADHVDIISLALAARF